jgi:hypothetical protein
MWQTTPDECKPYIDFWGRQLLFREIVIGFMGGNQIQKETDILLKEIGHHCKGQDIEECQSYFGKDLTNICATCPQ